MRVERARSDESDIDKADANTRSLRPQTTSSLSTPRPADGANQGVFSKFLDEARQTSENSRPEKRSGDGETEGRVDKPGDGKEEDALQAKGAKRDDQKSFSDDGDGDEGQAWAPAQIFASDGTGDTNAAVPQARAILHVADLERIVSAVRSDTFAGSKQVTIDLKNSVLDGLKIQLTLTEQGNLKAEFIASSESIKKQLDARRNELESVLRDRSIKCSELNVRVVKDDHEGLAVEGNDRAS